MGKAHGNKGYVFEFSKRNDLLNFVLLYKDLFVPYSYDTIKDQGSDTIETHRTAGGNLYSTRELNDNRVAMMEQGYIINGNTIKVNLKKEGRNEILESGLFDKVQIRRCYFKYVYKEA